MRQKMTTLIISCLVSFILGVGSMGVYTMCQPPKTVINNYETIQNVESRNEQINRQDQSQTTIILQTDRTNYRFVDIKADGKTNRTYKFISVTNRTSKTN